MSLEIFDYKSAFSHCLKSVENSTPAKTETDACKEKSVQNRDTAYFSEKAVKAIASASENAKTPAVEEKQVTDVQNTKAKEEKQKTLAEMIQEQMDKIDSMFSEREYDKNSDSRLTSIKSKMYRGLTLNSSEQQYLASKDPDTYSKFQQMDSARRMFRCSLRACRTRDEVNSMRLSNALTALAEYRKAVRKGGDGNAIAGLNLALENEIRSYAKSADYQRLPTVAECNKFDRELAKARRYECEKRREELKARTDRHYKKKRKTVGDGKRTVAQVMASPLARKVLASRRRSGGCSCAGAVDFGYSQKYKLG